MEEVPSSAQATWVGDRSWFRLDLPYDHEIDADEPEPISGNHGPRPTDLLLAAVASCSGISAEALLRKMRQPVISLSVHASGDRAEEWPRQFTRIVLRFELSVGPGSDPTLIEKAINRAVKKYCPVSATVESGEGGTTVEYDIHATEAPAE